MPLRSTSSWQSLCSGKKRRPTMLETLFQNSEAVKPLFWPSAELPTKSGNPFSSHQVPSSIPSVCPALKYSSNCEIPRRDTLKKSFEEDFLGNYVSIFGPMQRRKLSNGGSKGSQWQRSLGVSSDEIKWRSEDSVRNFCTKCSGFN